MQDRAILSFLINLFLLVSLANAQTDLNLDGEGWTVFTPSADSRIIYVSESDGDDQTAVFYTIGDSLIGSDVFNPQGDIKPYKTILAAYAQVRNNFPDYLLLKKGDVWFERLPNSKSGRSLSEPMLYGSYGDDELPRPLLKTGSNDMISMNNRSFIAIAGIHGYAHTRNPDDQDYVSGMGGKGIRHTGFSRGLYVENCKFDFYLEVAIHAGNTSLTNAVFRRNVVTNNYSINSHSQGIYANNIDTCIIEDNVFDHNGWLIQQEGPGQNQANGQATIFNHNAYLENMKNFVLRNNLFMRASSIGCKFTGYGGPEAATLAKNIIIDNNLYLDCEIGISIGGNENPNVFRFNDVNILNNIFLDMGRSRPTNRDIAWGIGAYFWNGGKIHRNLFIHQPRQVLVNSYALDFGGRVSGVEISENITHGIFSTSSIVRLRNDSTFSNVSIKSNYFQSNYSAGLISYPGLNVSNISFSDNKYYSSKYENSWFDVSGSWVGMETWQSISYETGLASFVEFPDTSRNIEKYHNWLGEEPSIDAFINEAVKQQKNNWRQAYTTCELNRYLRAGFALNTIDVCDDRGVNEGGATFLYVNSSYASTQYQWQSKLTGNFEDLVNNNQYSGVNNDTLSILQTSTQDDNRIFRCIVKNGSCHDTSAHIKLNVNLPLSADHSIFESQLILYPNPAQDFTVLKLNKELLQASKYYSLHDISGRIIDHRMINDTENIINLSHLDSGIYFIQVDKARKILIKNN
jgi:hypothetical protein